MNRNMKAITWAMEVRGIDPGPWRLLMVLCGHVGKRSYDVWPSFATMAEKAEISRASAKRFIALLIERGLIEQVDTKWRDNGARSVNVYRIRVDEIVVVAEDEEEEDDYVSERDPRVKLNRGPGHSCDPGAGVTADPCREPLKEGTSIIEDSPLSLTGEAPPQDLFGGELPEERPQPLHEYVAAEWAKLREQYPRTNAIQVWNPARINGVKARAAEFIRDTDLTDDPRKVWDMMFAAIRADQWLRGEADPSPKYPNPFSLSIDYLLRPRVFANILEKADTNDHDNRLSHDPRTGRRMGPAEQAGRASVERLVAAGERGGSVADPRSHYGARRRIAQ